MSAATQESGAIPHREGMAPASQSSLAAEAAAAVDPRIKRLVLVTDAWDPQINGVVRTLKTTAQVLRSMGVEVHLITPQDFNTVPCPTYPSIKLAVLPGEKVRRRIAELAPHALHIATEGSLGWAARNFAVELGIPFTTAYHTRFPEYVQARLFIPPRLTYAYLNWFHRFSRSIMVPTPVVKRDLDSHGFPNVKLWSRGVDTRVFQPPAAGGQRRLARGEPGWPVFLYAGRVAVEKNVEAFLSLDLPGQKWVVGDGPALDGLKERYPEARYFGFLNQTELAAVYGQASVFVFPSRTDTFGLVLLEAMATGLPVAAYPVSGPIDVVGFSGAGVLNEDLRAACLGALEIDPAAARAHAEQFSWDAATTMFRSHLAFVDPRQFAEGVRAWSAARVFLEEGEGDGSGHDLVASLPPELRALLPPVAPEEEEKGPLLAGAACNGVGPSLLRLAPSAAGVASSNTSTTATAGVLALPAPVVPRKPTSSAFTLYIALAQAAFWGSAESLLLYLGKAPAAAAAMGGGWDTAEAAAAEVVGPLLPLLLLLLLLAALSVTKSLGPSHNPHQRRALGLRQRRRGQRQQERLEEKEEQSVQEPKPRAATARTPPMSPASTASSSYSAASSLSGWESS